MSWARLIFSPSIPSNGSVTKLALLPPKGAADESPSFLHRLPQRLITAGPLIRQPFAAAAMASIHSNTAGSL